MDTAIDTAASCANCGTSLTGEYCHGCGQKRIDADWQSVPRFLRHFADELAHLDFKTVRSVAALFTPGKLPAEFLAGRRRRVPRAAEGLLHLRGSLLLPRAAGLRLDHQGDG